MWEKRWDQSGTMLLTNGHDVVGFLLFGYPVLKKMFQQESA